MATSLRLAALALFAAMLPTMTQSQGLELFLDREMVFPGNQDPYGQLTCRAIGNNVNIESVAMIWVKATGETTELIAVTTNSPHDDVSHDGIVGNGKLQSNNGHIVLDEMDADVCESSYFLCETTIMKSSGETERVIATAWPGKPQSTQPEPDDTSSDSTRALEAMEIRIGQLSESLAVYDKRQIADNEKASDRLSELEGKLVNVTQVLTGLEKRVAILENKTSESGDAGGSGGDCDPTYKPTVCEKNMEQNSCERVVSMDHNVFPIPINCDAQTDGGGWIIIQRRVDGNVDFNLGWDSYMSGFGDLDNEYWFGNSYLNRLTSADDYELRVDFTAADGNDYYAQYDLFKVGDESENFRLTVGEYSGTIGESDSRGMTYHNGADFSTFDRDNDRHRALNCAETYNGGWWYVGCVTVNLNAKWGLQDRGGIFWNSGPKYLYLTSVEMKIRLKA